MDARKVCLHGLMERAGSVKMLLAATKTKNAPSESPSLEMACPRCRAVQPAASECLYCGIVIHKARRSRPPTRRIETRISWQPKRWARWSHRLGDALLGFVVSLAIALVLEWGLLHLMRAAWFIYIETPVGDHYLFMEGPHAATIQYLAQMDLLFIALMATATAMLVSLVSGVVSQLLHIRRFLHEPFGVVANLFIWVPPLTAATGWLVHREDDMIQWGMAYILSFLPTLLLFNRGLYLAKAAVPELAALFSAVGRIAAGFGQRRAHRNANRSSTT